MSAKRKNEEEHVQDVKPVLLKEEEEEEESERPLKKEKHEEPVGSEAKPEDVQEEEQQSLKTVEKPMETEASTSQDANAVGSHAVDKDGDVYWQLDGKRRAKVNKWKGTTYIDIREYYEKGGQLLPGKKGISLSASTWKVLQSKMKEIGEVLESM